MLPLVVIFVFWLALHGRLSLYASFATTKAAGGGSSTVSPGNPANGSGNPGGVDLGTLFGSPQLIQPGPPSTANGNIFGGGPAGGTGNIAGDIGAGNSSDASILQAPLKSWFPSLFGN